MQTGDFFLIVAVSEYSKMGIGIMLLFWGLNKS